MLWQQDNNQAANGTVAHNARASATHNERSADMKITMTMDNRKILMTRIMMMRMRECKADPGRMMIMTMITEKEVLMKVTTKMIKGALADKTAGINKADVPARDLAA